MLVKGCSQRADYTGFHTRESDTTVNEAMQSQSAAGTYSIDIAAQNRAGVDYDLNRGVCSFKVS